MDFCDFQKELGLSRKARAPLLHRIAIFAALLFITVAETEARPDFLRVSGFTLDVPGSFCTI